MHPINRSMVLRLSIVWMLAVLRWLAHAPRGDIHIAEGLLLDFRLADLPPGRRAVCALRRGREESPLCLRGPVGLEQALSGSSSDARDRRSALRGRLSGNGEELLEEVICVLVVAQGHQHGYQIVHRGEDVRVISPQSLAKDFHGLLEERLSFREPSLVLKKIGEVVEAPGVLDDFPDLKEKVENHDLSEADAIKLAQAEVFKKQADQANKTQADQQAEETNYKAAVQKYSAEVTALEDEWKKNDVDYSSKSAIIYEKLNDIQKQPPEQWPFLVKQAYDLITSAVKKSGKGLSSDTAVTKEHGGDGGQQEPKTRLEAISLALERGF